MTAEETREKFDRHSPIDGRFRKKGISGAWYGDRAIFVSKLASEVRAIDVPYRAR
jgi:hypothetical protein